MTKQIGELIGESRARLGLSQDRFGRKYGVSGAAVFKFEKDYVSPSLDLWMQMAKDMAISEQEAVLLWVQAKLPKEFQGYIEIAGEGSSAAKRKPKRQAKKKLPSADEMRQTVLGERSAPKGLKAMLKDDALWALYRPTAEEIETLATEFAKLGAGSKDAYREALRLLREFGRK